jgi:branched-chain amino acid aminotransferase
VGYGSSVFEGIRAYETPQGPAIFRVQDHMQRLINSARIYRMELSYSVEDFTNTASELVRINKMGACYIKPLVLRGYGEVGVNPLNCPVESYMACWSWGSYLGPDALAKGVDVCVSSWTRIAPNTLPAMSKAGANYMNSQLIRMEAIVNGYTEGIALDADGHVSEGSGMNIFLVHNGTLYTPPLAASILPGITRDSISKLAADLDLPVKESVIPREMLYIADEVFIVGTAVEVTPIRSIDKMTIGKGSMGPITRKIQEEFFALTGGKKADRHNWLTHVNAPVAAVR